MDNRARWIGRRVLSCLGLGNFDLFENSLEANDGELNDKMSRFVNATSRDFEDTFENRIIYVRRTYFDKLIEVEKEITEWRIVPPTFKSPTPPQSSKKKGKGKAKGKEKGATKEKETDKKKGKDKSKGKNKKDALAIEPETVLDDADNAEYEETVKENFVTEESAYKKTDTQMSSSKEPPVLDPEIDGTIEYYTMKRFVPMMVKYPKLTITFGYTNMDSSMLDSKYIYIIRTTESSVPVPLSDDHANYTMPDYFLLGSCQGLFLKSMLNVLKLAYLEMIKCQKYVLKCDSVLIESNVKEIKHKPLETGNDYENRKIYYQASYYQQVINKNSVETRLKSNNQHIHDITNVMDLYFKDRKVEVNDIIINQVLGYLISFINSIEKFNESNECEIQLQIPNIPEIYDKNVHADALIKNSENIKLLESAVKSWCAYITSNVDDSHNALEDGPLKEYEFWMSYNSIISKLVEYLQNDNIRKILSALNSVNSPIVKTFTEKEEKLLDAYKTSKETLKLMLTSLRYFQIVTNSYDLKTVGSNLSSMMHGISILWLLSKYYSSDDRMLLLLENIANCLCKKIEVLLAVESIFTKPFKDIHRLANDGKIMMIKWKECYMKTRKFIEESGMIERWEFDKKKLFHRTDYLANVCDNLSNVAQVLIDFQNIFGPELKMVTENQSDVEEFIDKLYQLIQPIKTVDFNIFIVDNKENFDVIMNDFYKEVSVMERKTHFFIDSTFDSLRSSEDAVNMLLKFVNFQTRPSIHNLFTTKFDYIWEKFINEIAEMDYLFQVHKNTPPLLRNHPPISGAIYWFHSIHAKIRKSWNNFNKVQELEDSPKMIIAQSQLKSFSTEVISEKTKYYNSWLKEAQKDIKDILQDNLLKTVPKNNCGEDIDNDNAHSSLSEIEKEKKKTKRGSKIKIPKNINKNNVQIKAKAVEDCKLLSDSNLEYRVNFKQELFQLFEEIILMERLGFKLPTNVKFFAMQKDRFNSEYESLNGVIKSYNEILNTLTPFEIKILRRHLYKVEMKIYPGSKRITWTSLIIMEYYNDCIAGMHVLQSICNQVAMINDELQSILEELLNFNLFPIITPALKGNESNNNSPRYPCELFFEKMESMRTEEINKMKSVYKKIGPILKKLEYIVLGKETGRSHIMIDVYNHWEMKIYKTFIQICIQNIQEFTEILKCDDCVFQIDAILQASEVSINPSLQEINNILLNDINDFIIRFKCFPKWIKGTCIDSAEPDKNSFYSDIIEDANISEVLSMLLNTTNNAATNSQTYIKKWSKFKSLWSYDKQSSCEEYTQKYSEIVKFDERLSFFENIVGDLNDHSKFMGIGSIQINLQPLIVQIQDHALQWKTILGECLIVSTKEKTYALFNIINRLRKNLNQRIKGINDFKLVMLTVSQIKKTTISMEVMYNSIHEVFFMLKSHNIKLKEEDVNRAQMLKSEWHNLYLSSLFRLEKLDVIKDNFSRITLEKVKDFTLYVDSFVEKFKEKGPGSVEHDFERGLILMKEYKALFDHIEAQKSILCSAERLFDNPLADYAEFIEAKDNYDQLELIYKIYTDMNQEMETWSKITWMELNTNILIEGCERFRNVFRKLTRTTRTTPCGAALNKRIDQFKNMIPLMESLKNEAIRDRHWEELMKQTGKTFEISDEQFTLGNMFSLELHDHQEIVEEIVNSAIKELTIERDIMEIENFWTNIKFNISQHVHNDTLRGYTLLSCEEMITTLEDHFMNLQRMGTSRFIGPFKPKVKKWDKNLSKINEVVEQWLSTQQKWMYLESIFVGTEIRTQLPKETNKFDSVDAEFIEIMDNVANQNNVVHCCLVTGRLEKLKKISNELDNCQKSLIDYIDLKRQMFPRFFFISTDELLSILGSSEPTAVQEHINKMFDNIKELQILNNDDDIPIAIGMVSSENEVLEFQQDILLNGRIENWMNDVVNEMKVSNRYLTKKCIYDYGKTEHRNRNEWIIKNHGMVCLAANIVWWTIETENSFAKLNKGEHNAMKNFLNSLNTNLENLVYGVRKELSPNDFKKIKTMITIDVHARDIVESFVMKHVIDSQDFEWESQLRFYWLKAIDNLQIQQCTGSFDYGYEYMGLNGRLVITPLTDRIYLTCTQALTMHLGGAPAGPAGTGKTETTKDLAKALGLLCVVTNCGESMTFQAVGQTFAGLCTCGAWGCFDEFNRIDISMLSVISTQLQCIRSALIMKLKTFDFLGVELEIKCNVGIFITMNPGYAGRTELPKTIKTLFRPVMCIVPDFEIICQISLYSDGFLEAKVLAKKITVLYKLAQDQLSKQSHYDWGLRALIALLRMSGIIKREVPDESESEVIMKALRNINQPKFIMEDAPLFLNLVKDIFPGFEYPKDANTVLVGAIEEIMKRKDFEILNSQIEKIYQLNKTMITQHCNMLVGPTGGGKTTIVELLVEAENFIGLPTNLITINPKAITVSELYGVQNSTTREWTDGLFSMIFRKMNKPSQKPEKHYLLFDGDVDALWIENLNSVMDDNKLLTLANGERIRLASNCALLFEVGNLTYASPATVSRAGMIYVDPNAFGYSPYWNRWLKRRTSKDEMNLFKNLFEVYVPGAIAYIYFGNFGTQQQKPLKMIIEQSPLNLVIQLCCLIDALIPDIKNGEKYDDDLIQCAFIISLYYSLGATIIKDHRPLFDEYVKSTCSMMGIDDTFEKRATTQNLPKLYPTLYDYCLNVKDQCWDAWEWLIPTYIHNRAISFSDILVPTVDTIQIDWFMSLLLDSNRPILLTGDIGTSKTANITNFLRKLDTDSYLVARLNFSSRTSSIDVQKNIESLVEKRTKNIYGPPLGKKLLIFIDDMNMPLVDEYGTQQPIAFLKLFFDKAGFYDREKDLQWKNLTDLYFISAMGKSGGGRNDVDPRFISKFLIYNLTFPSDETLNHIYLSILNGHLSIFPIDIQETASNLIQITLDLFKIILLELPPTPSKFHYIYNLRDLSRIISGLCLTEPNLYPEPKYIIRAWRNEFCRVICDRLINNDDQTLLKEHMASMIMKYFTDDSSEKEITVNEVEPEPMRKSTTSMHGSDSDIITDTGIEITDEEGTEEEMLDDKSKELTVEEYVLRDPLLFGDFRNALNHEPRLYEDLLDYDAVYYLFQEILEDYNENVAKVSLVLFEDYLENLTRIHRVLRMERNHMMLIGFGSSGKKSMVKLATFAAEATLFEITTTHGYNEIAFKEDLKLLYNQLITTKSNVVFLVSSTQIIDECFLDLLNSILANGMISTLYTDEEKDGIISMLEEDVVKAGLPLGRNSIWDYFCKLCVNKLHIVYVTPPGATLCNQCSSFPGLVNNMTINWLFPWPQQALLAVANIFLADVERLPEQYKQPIIQHLIHVHESVKNYSNEYFMQLKRFNYVTPRHYIEFISNFLKFVESKDKYILEQCKRFEDGIAKIDDANMEVLNLNKDLEIQKVTLSGQSEQCASLIKKIRLAKSSTEEKMKSASENNKLMLEKNEMIKIQKAEAEEALTIAMPALEAARLALESLEKGDITEIRSFATPPEDVQIVGECILIMRGYQEINWKTVKGMMSDPSFLRHLLELDYEKVTQNQVKQIKTHMKGIKKMDTMVHVSKAGYGLLKFLLAVLDFCAVFKEVKPKRDKVEQLEKEYNDAMSFLEQLNVQIASGDEELKTLNDTFEETLKNEQDLKTVTDTMMKRLTAADKLLAGLSSERNRWQEELKALNGERTKIFGGCLLSAAFFIYLGPFTYEFREKMIYVDWLNDIQQRNIPIILPYKVELNLTNDVEVSGWISEGLPSDEFSIQNGILTVYSEHFPICIDPQSQAINWIKKREMKNSIKVMTLNDSDYVKKIELAIKYGQPVLIQNVTSNINPVLDQLFEKNIRVHHGRQFIMLSGNEVEYDQNFRLYLTTKLTNPQFHPNLYTKLIFINYLVTTLCLEEQLLKIVVCSESPELEDQREDLIQTTFENKSLLRSLEDSLLLKLTMTTGNILDNVDLVSTLDDTKTKATEVVEKLKLAEITSSEINILCNEFRPVAIRGAILFFILLDMCHVNNMYQYSLPSYIEIFRLSICKAIEFVEIKDKLDSIIERLTNDIYEFGCTGIFERDKLFFSLMITINLEKSKGNLLQSYIDFFIKGAILIDKHDIELTIPWIQKESWEDILFLSTNFLNTFGDLQENITQNSKQWEEWQNSDEPESLTFPCGYSDKLNEFEKLMLLRCFRIDRIFCAISHYITKTMNEKYITPPIISLKSIYEETTANTLVVFILSAGSDPMNNLIKFAKKNNMYEDRFKYLALGFGQEPIALSLLDSSITEGSWLVIQNCHLLSSFLYNLEKILDRIENPHKDFRIWLTTEPTSEFPVGLLQRAIKVVTEPPSGLKLNLQNTYTKLQNENLEICSHSMYKKLVYVLAFFHAVIQERRKYEKIGWNIIYDFNESDYTISLEILQSYLDRSLHTNKSIPWETVKFLIGEIMYGGRVIDFYDRRVLTTYINEYFGDFLVDTFQPFYFYHNDSVKYTIPNNTTRKGYLGFISKIPLYNSPEVFGLHLNAEIGYYTQSVKRIWDYLIEMQAETDTTSSSLSKEDIISNLAQDILNKVPQKFNINKVKKQFEMNMTPSCIVLLQELERFNSLTWLMFKTTSSLLKALSGEVGMDAMLDNLSSSIYNGRLPKEWSKLTPPTHKHLAGWLDQFEKRFIQYEYWSTKEEPFVMWLSGLHVPESYLVAHIQTVCRLYTWPLDSCTQITQVTSYVDPNDVEERPKIGCYIHGLYLEGARWDTEDNCLKKSHPKVLITELPIVHVIPTESTKINLQNTILTPVYTTSERRNAMGVGLVFESHLRTLEHNSHWILQGVCLVMNTD